MLPSVVIPVVVIAFFGLIGFLIYGSIQASKQRTADFEAIAQELGLQFFAKLNADSNLMERFAEFRLFTHRGQIANLTRGETPQATLSIFDYTYSTGSGKNRRTHLQTVVAMESDRLQVPAFHLRPENVFDSIGHVLGFQDIDFDHHSGFSRAYVLKSEQSEDTRAFFDDPLLDFFVGQESITFETCNGAFLYYRAGKTIQPAALRDFLAQGYTVFKAFTDRIARG